MVGQIAPGGATRPTICPITGERNVIALARTGNKEKRSIAIFRGDRYDPPAVFAGVIEFR